MSRSIFAGSSLFGLLRELRDEVKLFIRQELELVRSEMSEKVAHYRSGAITLAVGGSVAFAGLMIFLGGLGLLFGFIFQKAGLDPALADFVGLGGIGFLVVLAGVVLILSGAKTFSRETLAPEKTVETIRHLRGTDTKPKKPAHEMPKRSPAEIESDVFATEERIGETLGEISHRTSPAHIKARATKKIRAHPYRWSAVALGSGLVGSFLLMRRLRRRGA